MNVREILTDLHVLEEELLEFERKYGPRSETFYTSYRSGEEPENAAWVLDFSEWASVYRTWLARQAEYRNEVDRLSEFDAETRFRVRAAIGSPEEGLELLAGMDRASS
jgi:hypothetical protein